MESMFMDRKPQYHQEVSFSQFMDPTHPRTKSWKILYKYQQTDSKVSWKGKIPIRASTTLKRNKVSGLTLPDFKTSYETTVMKTVRC